MKFIIVLLLACVAFAPAQCRHRRPKSSGPRHCSPSGHPDGPNSIDADIEATKSLGELLEIAVKVEDIIKVRLEEASNALKLVTNNYNETTRIVIEMMENGRPECNKVNDVVQLMPRIEALIKEQRNRNITAEIMNDKKMVKSMTALIELQGELRNIMASQNEGSAKILKKYQRYLSNTRRHVQKAIEPAIASIYKPFMKNDLIDLANEFHACNAKALVENSTAAN